MSTKLYALAAGCAVALLALACDEKKPEATPAATATTSAAPKADPPAASSTAAPAASSAAPAASSSAGADAAPPGAIDMTLGDVKATKGKVDDGQKKFKLNLPRIQRKCLFPEQKKDAAALGTGNLKLTIEVDAEGKPKKITTAVEGKVPDSLVACVKAYIEKDVEFSNDAKATLEANLVFGPKK